jgi:cholesterol oxidase
MQEPEYDYVIIGSGFGGSVSALRLSEKGYRVLVIEKGRWFDKPEKFPVTNWQLRKWFWLPIMGAYGIFKMTYFRHVVALSGTGVGGGSLVYANTLPVPGDAFFQSGSWAGLDDWQQKLIPFYALARQMLGAAKNPYSCSSDEAIRELARQTGSEEHFHKPDVAVYFGKPGVTVSDPYFEGKGPERTGCIQCGGCMLGCRYNAKNTLDKNYLYLARQLGAEIIAEHEVVDVVPLNPDGGEGYEVVFKRVAGGVGRKVRIQSRGVIFSGGVTGTVPLLLKLKQKSLARLSDMTGHGVRTNSESLIGVTTFDKDRSFSEGIAIGSILHLDKNRHLEPVKYPAGSGFWRLFMAPMVHGRTFAVRLIRMVMDMVIHPVRFFKTLFVDDWSKRTLILLYMESIESTLSIARSGWGMLYSKPENGPLPTAFNPKAREAATRIESVINGKAMVMNTETLFGIPTTAHILGGACMGKDESTGVVDKDNKVFNYKNMMVCDGSMISANPGVNPSLSITAITEYAMSKIPSK